MGLNQEKGKIILIHGPSSAGKSTLAAAVHQKLDEPFIRFSFDLFLDGDSLPRQQMRSGQFEWQAMRPRFFKGYHACWAALAGASNNLLIDHIIEEKAWVIDLANLLEGIDIFCVGIHCSLPELERRERERGNRRVGDARRDLEFVHKMIPYDLELDAEEPLETNVDILIKAWHQRSKPTVFDRLRAEL